ncbi:Putative cytosolic protein, partial (plasmid) [Borrelia nietonii YOR]
MSTRDRLASMAERMIGRFREESYFLFYKGHIRMMMSFESPEI